MALTLPQFFGVRHPPKNQIVILIDRLPAHLNFEKPLDFMGRQLKPLLVSAPYSVEWKTGALLLVAQNLPQLKFIEIPDPTARALQFIQGLGDLLYNGLPVTKTDWVAEQSRKSGNPPIRTQMFPGTAISYLGIRPTHWLNREEIKTLLKKIIPVQDWAKFHLKSWVTPLFHQGSAEDSKNACSKLKELSSNEPVRALTTPQREGYELLYDLKHRLSPCGIHLKLIMLDPSKYLSAVRAEQFEVVNRRWFPETADHPVDQSLFESGIQLYRWNHSLQWRDDRLNGVETLSGEDMNSFQFLSKLKVK